MISSLAGTYLQSNAQMLLSCKKSSTDFDSKRLGAAGRSPFASQPPSLHRCSSPEKDVDMTQLHSSTRLWIQWSLVVLFIQSIPHLLQLRRVINLLPGIHRGYRNSGQGIISGNAYYVPRITVHRLEKWFKYVQTCKRSEVDLDQAPLLREEDAFGLRWLCWHAFWTIR